MAVIVLDGLKRMYYEEEDIFYYITLMNENYEMPILPMGSTEGICRGIYKLSSREAAAGKPKVQLFGSGAILRESLRAQDLLERHFGVGSNVYSVTSYKSLYYDGRQCDRWNRLHPQEPPRPAYVSQVLQGESGPVVAALDYVGAVGLSIAPWVCNSPRPTNLRSAPGEESGLRAAEIADGAAALTLTLSQRERGPRISSYVVLGADGFGRSEARKELRRFFEVDAENIALAALVELAREGKYPQKKLAGAIKTLGLDPDKLNPVAI